MSRLSVVCLSVSSSLHTFSTVTGAAVAAAAALVLSPRSGKVVVSGETPDEEMRLCEVRRTKWSSEGQLREFISVEILDRRSPA